MFEGLTRRFRRSFGHLVFGALAITFVLNSVEWAHAFTVLENFERYDPSGFPFKWRSRSNGRARFTGLTPRTATAFCAPKPTSKESR